MRRFFAFLLDYSRDIVVQRVGRDLRADAVRKLESLSYMQKSEKDDGACLSLVQNDVDTIQQDYVASLGEIYFQICCFLLAVGSAIAIQPVMTLIMIAVSVLTAAFPKLTEKRLQTYQENEQQAKAGYLTAITQIFSGFFQLKIFNAFSGANRAHDEANENLYRKKLRSRRIRRILYAGAYGCGNLVVLGTWVLGLFFVARGVITLPALITFAGLMNLVAGPVQIISERYSSTIAASAVCKRVLAFLDEPTDEASGWGSQPLTRVETVSLRDISCRRGEREILKARRSDAPKGRPHRAARRERGGEVDAFEGAGRHVRRGRRIHHQRPPLPCLPVRGFPPAGHAAGPEDLRLQRLHPRQSHHVLRHGAAG